MSNTDNMKLNSTIRMKDYIDSSNKLLNTFALDSSKVSIKYLEGTTVFINMVKNL